MGSPSAAVTCAVSRGYVTVVCHVMFSLGLLRRTRMYLYA